MLSTLWEEDGRTIGAIADRLALESSTVTPLVKRLETAGLLSRRRNPADERQVMVHLTEAGAALELRSGCLSETLLTRSGLTVEQILALNEQVKNLRDAMSDPPA